MKLRYLSAHDYIRAAQLKRKGNPMALSQKQAEDARVKIASILETAVSVEDAEHQFSELVGTPVKLKVIDPTEENAVGMRMTETFFGGRVIAKTGQMISAVSV